MIVEPQMTDLTPDKQATKAIAHMLRRIADIPVIGYYCGHGSQSYALLVEALSTLTSRPISDIQAAYPPGQPAPGEERKCLHCKQPLKRNSDEDSSEEHEYLSPEEVEDLQCLARKLLAKCGRMMTPPSIATCEYILDDHNWCGDGEGLYLAWGDEILVLRHIGNLYFNELIS